MQPSQLISRENIDEAYDNLSKQLTATTLMFECEQRANMPLRAKVEELAAELDQITVDHEREIEAWKRGAEAQANEIDRFKNALQQIADPLNSAPQHKHPAAHLREIARIALNKALEI